MKIGKSQNKCQICSIELEDIKYVPMPEWKISKYLCSACYSKKLSEYYIIHQEKSKE
jgi:hypothetical protein